MALTAAERKRNEIKRRRKADQVLVREWVHKDDRDRLKKYAAKLRKARERSD